MRGVLFEPKEERRLDSYGWKKGSWSHGSLERGKKPQGLLPGGKGGRGMQTQAYSNWRKAFVLSLPRLANSK